jgi:hypothetical protein
MNRIPMAEFLNTAAPGRPGLVEIGQQSNVGTSSQRFLGRKVNQV